MEQSEFSQSNVFNMETDHDDTEADVEFLAEDRVPCLICSVDVEINNIIKREIDESEDWAGNTEEGQPSGGSGLGDNKVFHGFLKWFGVEMVKKGKQRSIDKGWDGEGGDILRFCGMCKIELIRILELQKQLDELKEKVKNGVEEVKRKVERFEGGFKAIGIYEKDERYKMVRSQVVNYEISTDLHRENLHSSLKQPDDHGNRRKSSRLKTKGNIPSSELNHYVDKNKSDTSREEIPSEGDQHEIPDLSDVNQHFSPDIPVAPKTFPVDTTQNKFTRPEKAKNLNEIVRKKFRGRKPVPISHNAVQEKVHPRKSTRIATKVQSNDNSRKLVATEKNRIRTTIQKKSLRVSRRFEEHALEDDTKASHDNSDVIVNISKRDFGRNWDYELDPTTNTITFQGVKFSIMSDQEEKVSCNFCSAILTYSRRIMRYHIIQRHTNIYACSQTQCMFKGHAKRSLEIHFEAVHNRRNIRKKFPCKICGKPVTSGISHEWTHMNKKEKEEHRQKKPDWLRKSLTKTWACDECDKVFIQKCILEKHKERHNGTKEPFKERCQNCGKTFRNLKHHMRYQHGGPKRFECMEQGCGKRFGKLSALRDHKDSVYRNLKPWKCTKCTRQFSRKCDLKKHMDLHFRKDKR